MREEIEDAIKASPDDQVDLGEMAIKDSEVGEIVEFITKCKPNIQELFLHNNLISDTGAIVFSSAISALKHLEKVDLQFNNIGKLGFTAIYGQNAHIKFAIHGNKIVDNAELVAIKKTAFRP